MKKYLFLVVLLTSALLFAQTTTSPNMGLPVPQVGVTPGPDWATDINNSLNIIDAHDHTPGNGVPITPSAMNITSDLPFNNHNATLLRSTRFQSQSSPLSGASDLGATYVSGVDLYYNDGNGNQVRITQGGSVTGATGSITGLVSPASASYSAGSQTFVWQSDVNKAANMDARSYILRNSTTSSNGLTLSAPTLTSDYTITLPLLPAATNFMLMDVSGNITAPWHLDNSTLGVVSNIIKVLDAGITDTQIALATITGDRLVNNTITLTQLDTSILVGHTQTVTTTGTVSVPSDVTSVHIECVGGGAGGGGGSGITATGAGGGSGGAGASPVNMDMTVTASSTLTITIGAGGAGATSSTHGNAGNNGSAGTDTTITGTNLAILCPGSSGVGVGGTAASSGSSTGGAGTYTTTVVGSITGSAGGNSATAFNTTGSSGAASVWASTGASGGTSGGTNTNSGRGGGGGGGGLCKGGAAGNGGANGVAGGAGTAAASPCYGAGGGGGGGNGATSSTAGSTGGAGLGGAVIITWVSHS